MALRTHSGACHCGAVRFEFDAPADLVAWDCNCSICAMKRNVHTIVPGARFRLLAGDALREYRFATRTARHLFCGVCGVCPYYVPRSNPDSFAVTIYCIKPGTVGSIEVRSYDGVNWEAAYAATGIAACGSGSGGSGSAGGGGGAQAVEGAGGDGMAGV
ncbi:centromere V [Raphidocelis subcapitata]|uniref:Centromere V n=1 Tax=Raphidocelis subcapitata TaxID=307507 RepID=A0A2V0P1B3_9CHLO|nr:centromere V [Raphidocelis subcapitata]|eukprot:GBF92712.1 centromere V [Raphidocelis subcapitata]